MKKINFTEFVNTMMKFNEEHPDGKSHLYGVIVFTRSSFNKPYTVKERSYRTSNDNKRFYSGMISNSIYADCLDGKDNGVRLDWYMDGTDDGWKVDYCYFENAEA